MIQRIQTVYLLVAGLVIFGLFLFPYVNYSDLVGLGKNVKVTGIYGVSAGQPVHEGGFGYILQTIGTVVLGLLPLFTIFKFRQRKVQILLIWIEMVAIIFFGIWLYSSASTHLATVSQFLGAGNIGVGFFLLPIAIIFCALALGGVRRDEKLIRSADRLRA
ncbi:DUF4293 domain-containing protein [Sphingobacterium sp. InxBP1]|uniref:DUF4293 domain-containing protein n=1 Tax=Sphingobacterium sp. InxBP1 TaxID=2870328 RepID=UPI002242E4F9|nr:DUF4293 domain-containing protein [Sphingobacterium sp. InxBP1]MCW8312567.1 DUF4293 domain-containing protein [Sphingobacterium sp. InxBP1]